MSRADRFDAIGFHADEIPMIVLPVLVKASSTLAPLPEIRFRPLANVAPIRLPDDWFTNTPASLLVPV